MSIPGPVEAAKYRAIARIKSAFEASYAIGLNDREVLQLALIVLDAKDVPEISSHLTAEELSALPTKVEAGAAIAQIAKASINYKTKLATADFYETEFAAGNLTESEAIAAIEAIDSSSS